MAGMNYTFSADVAPFVGAMGEAIAAARRFESAVHDARDAELELGAAGASAAPGLAAEAAAMDAAAKSADKMGRQHVTLGGVLRGSESVVRGLERSIRDMGLSGNEAGIAASGAMHDYSRSLADAKSILADAERGINGLQSATDKHRISAISAAHGLKDMERGINGLENAAANASSSGSGFAKLTGMLGPLGMPAFWTGVTGLAAGAVPAVLSLGGGFAAFGAMAYPALSKVKAGLTQVTQAQKTYDAAKVLARRDPTKANLAAEQRDLQKLKATWASMPAPVRSAVSEIRQFGKAWHQASVRSGLQKAAFGDIKLAVSDAKKAIPVITRLGKAFQPVIGGFLKDLGKEVQSKGFRDFIRTLTREMGPAAHAVKGIGNALGGFITSLTKSEAKPGTQMLTNIGKFLKTITPGVVHGLTGLTRGISGLFDLANKVAGSSAMSGLVAQVKSIAHWAAQTFHDFTTPSQGSQGFLNQIYDLTGLGHHRTIKVPVSATPRLTGAAGLAQSLKGINFGQLKNLHYHGKAPAVSVPVKPKIEAKGGGADIRKQISDAAAKGGSIPLKGKVTLTGLKAGIQQQIAGLHIPDSKVKISVAISGVGSAKAQMASVVAAAKHDAAAAAAALNSLGAAGAAAGRSLDQGLAGGILAGASSVVAAAASVAAAAGAAARRAAGIHSPSKVWHGIGANMIKGLILGLEGGKAQVQAAARAISGAAAPFKDATITQTIKKLREDVRKAFAAGDITKHQRDGLVDFIDRGNQRLMHLARQRAKIMGEIKAATALAHSVTQAAIGSADITGIASGVLAAQNKGTPGMTIQEGQQQQLQKIRQFTHMIRQLKREGLDKTSIKQLLAAGVSGGLPAAQRLLSEGPKAVKESARLQKEIIKASKQLGITGANAAYESASQMGKGLAQGLRDQLKPIVAAMRDIARALIATLRKELGLKPGQGLGGLLGSGGGPGTGGGGAGHHRPRHHGPPHMRMLPGGGHLIQPGPPPMVMHPGVHGGAPHQVIVTHVNVHLNGMQVGSAVQQSQLRHARRNIATGIKLSNRAA